MSENVLHLYTMSTMRDCTFHFALDLNPKCSSASLLCQCSLNKPLINFKSFSLASLKEYKSRLQIRWWHPHFIKASCFLPLPCLQVPVPWWVLDSSQFLRSPKSQALALSGIFKMLCSPLIFCETVFLYLCNTGHAMSQSRRFLEACMFQ